jgi:disulfide oxidoreductase YuzD
MVKAKLKEIKWLFDAEEHDYPAAESYLRIIYSEDRVAKMMARFRNAPVVQFKAKDIFRASQLSVLGISNSHVEKDRKKIRMGKSLSPLLLLRDEQHGKVVIADGYHRLCAIYEFDEDAWVQCKII